MQDAGIEPICQQGRTDPFFDRKARSVASRLGVPVTGTVGLLLKAKQTGLIAAIKPLLAALDAHQFHISRELVAEALRLAGE